MRGLGLRATVEQAALAADVTLAGRLELRSQQALLAMVASGAGITFAPEISVHGRTDVVARPTDPPLSRQLGWIRRRGRQLPPAAHWLVDQLALDGPSTGA
jgi:DNA-binding transcriptional LysR family regulator